MPMLTDRDAMIEVTLRSIRLMVDGDLADFAAVIHPDAVNREAVTEPPAARGQGPAAFHASARWLRAAWSEMEFGIEDVVVDGDLVVTYGPMSGRHTGTLVVWSPEGTVQRAFPATGREFRVAHAHFARIRDGLVAEHWAVRDDRGLAEQLGWVPPSPAFLVRCARATRRARRG